MKNNVWEVAWGWFDGESDSVTFESKDYTDPDDGTAEDWARDEFLDSIHSGLNGTGYGPGPDWVQLLKNGVSVDEWDRLPKY